MSSVKTVYPKKISCLYTMFWIFLVYPSTYKNDNSRYKTSIKEILNFLDSLV